jgi:hypothetical protein
MSWGVSDAALASTTDTLDAIGDVKAKVTRRRAPTDVPQNTCNAFERRRV